MALAAAARAAAFIAADVLGPTLVGRVADRRMRASARPDWASQSAPSPELCGRRSAQLFGRR